MDSQSCSHQGITILGIKAVLPHLKEMLELIRASGGYLGLSSRFTTFLDGFESRSWAWFYEDKARAKAAFAQVFLGPELVKELAEKLESAKDEEVAKLRSELNSELLTALAAGEDVFGFDAEEQVTEEERQARFAAMNDTERHESLKAATLFWMFLLSQLFSHLALMSFGRSMYTLVAKAKEGDDQAFLQAVQTDRTVLFTIPYFRQRMVRAQVGCEPEFLARLGRAISRPIFHRKVEYPELQLVFAMLDEEGLLGMPQAQLLDLCEELGVYGREYGVDDPGSLGKRRRAYLRRKK